MTEPNSTPPAPREPGVDAVSAEYRRGFDDGWEMATSITVENVQESLAVLDAMIAEGEPCEHDTGHCSCKERAALESLRAHFAATDPSRALRVPAAPAPDVKAENQAQTRIMAAVLGISAPAAPVSGIGNYQLDDHGGPACDAHGDEDCKVCRAAPVSGEPDEQAQRAAWFKWLCDNPQAAAYTVALVAKNRPFGPKLCATMNSGEVVGVMEDDKQPEYRYAAAPSGGSEVSEASGAVATIRSENARLRKLLALALDLVPRIDDNDPMAPALADWCRSVRAALRAGGPTP